MVPAVVVMKGSRRIEELQGISQIDILKNGNAEDVVFVQDISKLWLPSSHRVYDEC